MSDWIPRTADAANAAGAASASAGGTKRAPEPDRVGRRAVRLRRSGNTLSLAPHRTWRCAQRLDRAVVRCVSEPHHKKRSASTHIFLVGEYAVGTT